MSNSRKISGTTRFGVDMALSLVAFALIAVLTAGGSTFAAPMTDLSATGSSLAAMAVLALVLSLVAAFNMALFRHLREAYAKPASRRRRG